MKPADAPPDESLIGLLADRLRRAGNVAVLTGAGISAESGLRTFRGSASGADGEPADMAALWKEFDPMTLATPEAFARDPELVTRWYDWRRLGCLAAIPNPGHLALAALERAVTARGDQFWLLTQNVDRLHQRAGSSNVVELHGSIIQWRCTRTGATRTPAPEPFTTFPVPTEAGGLLRPDVVWFGEALPEAALRAADEAVRSCDVFLSAGTSGQVYPAAGFISTAKAIGAFTAEVNAEPTPNSGRVDCAILGRTGQILPDVILRAFPEAADGVAGNDLNASA